MKEMDQVIVNARILHLSLDMDDQRKEKTQLQSRMTETQKESNSQKLKYLHMIRPQHKLMVIHDLFIPKPFHEPHDLYHKYIFYHFQLENNTPVITGLAVTIEDITSQLQESTSGAHVILPPAGYLVKIAQSKIDHNYNWRDTVIIYPNNQGLIVMDTQFFILHS